MVGRGFKKSGICSFAGKVSPWLFCPDPGHPFIRVIPVQTFTRQTRRSWERPSWWNLTDPPRSGPSQHPGYPGSDIHPANQEIRGKALLVEPY